MPEFLPLLSSKMAINGTANGYHNGAVKPVIKPTIKPIDYEQVPKIGMAAYRAPSLLQPHRAREAIADAHAGRIPPLVGFFCGLASPPVAKVVAQLGYDAIWIDWEHSACSVETMTQVRPLGRVYKTKR
jgi:4-hydroxy-2-oxoheptanedioate aldolase